MKIRLWGTEDECRAAAERLMHTPGLVVLSVDGPRADRGASVMCRFYIEARLDPPPVHVASTTETRPRGRRRALRREVPRERKEHASAAEGNHIDVGDGLPVRAALLPERVARGRAVPR